MDSQKAGVLIVTEVEVLFKKYQALPVDIRNALPFSDFIRWEFGILGEHVLKGEVNDLPQKTNNISVNDGEQEAVMAETHIRQPAGPFVAEGNTEPKDEESNVGKSHQDIPNTCEQSMKEEVETFVEDKVTAQNFRDSSVKGCCAHIHRVVQAPKGQGNKKCASACELQEFGSFIIFHITVAHCASHAEEQDSSSSVQGASSSVSAGLLVGASLDTSTPDTYRAPPTPLPYDADVRYVRTVCDGLGARNDRSGPIQTRDSQLTSGNTEGEGEALAAFENLKSAEFKSQMMDSKPSSPGTCQASKLSEMVTLSDEEDTCPTCLEGYDKENPRIITKCDHHFHLACILEWMERSDNCPICGQ
ncbi:hypothetical protein KI387_004832, partial [Taxus chinensis]